MPKDGQNQKGQQVHAEGQQGDKTRKAFLDNLQNGRNDDSATDGTAERGSPFGANPSDGRHRIGQEREQHDEAEKNSELKKEGAPNSHKDRQV